MAITIVKKADKDERLAIRISAKDKFAVEMYAQKSGETISAITKRALDSMLRDPDKGLFKQVGRGKSEYLPDLCWDPLQPDRIVKLAIYAPELLDEYELTLWKIISEDTQYWLNDKAPDFKKIREEWVKLNSKAKKLLEVHG